MTDQITPAGATPEPITPPEPPSTLTPSTPEAAPEPQQAQPQYVTIESLKEFGKDLAKQLKQSSRDREKAFKKEVGDLLTNAGISPTPEQEAKLRESFEAKYDEEPEPGPAPASAVPIAPEQADQFLTKQISIVFGKAGSIVTKADPEFAKLQKAIDDNYSNPDGLPIILLAAHEAALTKVARLQNHNKTAAARVVGGGERTATTPKLSAKEKISKGLQASFAKMPPPR